MRPIITIAIALLSLTGCLPALDGGVLVGDTGEPEDTDSWMDDDTGDDDTQDTDDDTGDDDTDDPVEYLNNFYVAADARTGSNLVASYLHVEPLDSLEQAEDDDWVLENVYGFWNTAGECYASMTETNPAENDEEAWCQITSSTGNSASIMVFPEQEWYGVFLAVRMDWEHDDTMVFDAEVGGDDTWTDEYGEIVEGPFEYDRTLAGEYDQNGNQVWAVAVVNAVTGEVVEIDQVYER